MQERYSLRGASASKHDVHSAVSGLDKGLFPDTFCKVMPDLCGDPSYCSLMHADGAGTKASLAYIYWRETGDLSVWRGIAQDAVVMNIDDLACAGATCNLLLTSTIGRNKRLIPGEVIKEIIGGTEEFLEKMRKAGINIRFAGGETADLGDLVRTIVVDANAGSRMPITDVIRINPRPGDLIMGVVLFGKTVYEREYNGGMGANGLTSARHDVFSRVYADKYPESFDSSMPPELAYSGNMLLTDPVPGLPLNAGKLMLSPTRTYAPCLHEVLQNINRDEIHGIIHLTGGAQTKMLNFIEGLHIIKENLFPMPPLFSLIRAQSGTPLQEMYRVFNMGHRLEICAGEETLGRISALFEKKGFETRMIGRIEKAKRKKMTIITEEGEFTY